MEMRNICLLFLISLVCIQGASATYVSVQGNGTIDTHVRSGQPTVGFGTLNTIQFGIASTSNYETLIKFPLTTSSNYLATTNATIILKNSTSVGTPINYSLYLLTSAFTNSTVWDNKSLYDTVELDTIRHISGATELRFNISQSKFQEILSGQTAYYGFAIVRNPNASTGTNYFLAHSTEASDSANWPELRYNYTTTSSKIGIGDAGYNWVVNTTNNDNTTISPNNKLVQGVWYNNLENGTNTGNSYVLGNHANVSSDVKYGNYSFLTQIGSSSDYFNFSHLLNDKDKFRVSVKFYDNASNSSIGYRGVIGALNWSLGGSYYIGVYTDSFQNYYSLRPNGTWYNSTITRTTGWHDFRVEASGYSSGRNNYTPYIDGTQLMNNYSVNNYTDIFIGTFWAGSPSYHYYDNLWVQNLNKYNGNRTLNEMDFGANKLSYICGNFNTTQGGSVDVYVNSSNETGYFNKTTKYSILNDSCIQLAPTTHKAILNISITSAATFTPEFNMTLYTEVGDSVATPNPVINLGYAVNNYTITHFWDAPLGNIKTDSYNVSLNGTWYNGTTSTNITNTVAAHSYSNIRVFAYNRTYVSYNSTYNSLSSEVTANVSMPNKWPVTTNYTIGSMGKKFGMHVTNHFQKDGLNYSYFSQHYGVPDKTGMSIANTSDGINYQFIQQVLYAGGFNYTYESENSTANKHETGQLANGGWDARIDENVSGMLVRYQNDSSLINSSMNVDFRLMIDDIAGSNDKIATLDIFNGSTILNTTDIYRNNFTANYTYQIFNITYNNTFGEPMQFRINWTGNSYLKSDNIIVTPVVYGTQLQWDSAYSAFGNVVFDNGIYYLVYEGWCGVTAYCKTNVGLATSTDGLNFVKYSKNPLISYNSSPQSIESDGIGTPFLLKENGTWYLTYHSYHYDYTDMNQTDLFINIATGADILNLTKFSGNPILSPGANGTWDESTIGKRTILKQNGYYYMGYEGSTNANVTTGYQLSNWSTGLARSDCLACNNWTKYSKNPILPIAPLIQGWAMGNEQPDFVIFNNITYLYYRPYGWLANRMVLYGESQENLSSLWANTSEFVEDTPLQDKVAVLNSWLNFSIPISSPDIDGDTVTCANNITGNMPNCNFNWTVILPQETKNIMFNISDGNGYFYIENITVKVTDDVTAPASITELTHTSGSTWINWTWNNPSDIDYNHTNIYVNGSLVSNTTNQTFWNVTGLVLSQQSTIGTYTVDTTGNINATWTGQTAYAVPPPVATPANPVSDIANAVRTFTIEFTQAMNSITWYINGTQMQQNLSVNSATYVNQSAQTGNWIVNATGCNDQECVTQTWDWSVIDSIPSLISQSPDINSTNLIGQDLVVKYQMSNNFSDINESSVRFYFNTTRNGIVNTAKINGTLVQPGAAIIGFQPVSNDGVNHTFNIPADVIYPVAANMIDANSSNSCSQSCHIGADYSTKINPTNKNNIFKTRLFNVSNETSYNYFEAMVNVTTVAGQSPALVFFCNASYTTGALTTSPNCAQIGSFLPKTTFDHYHTQSNAIGTLGHSVIPYSVNTTSGTINNITISPNDNYFAIKFQSTGWNIYYSNNVTRQDQTRLSTNNGVGYSNFSGTLRWHVHKFNNNDVFSYYTCYNSSSTGTQYCSAMTQDVISEADINPIGAQITNPNATKTAYPYNQNMSINWTAGSSLTDGVILYYNLTLWQAGTFVMNIGNFSNTTFSTSWNPGEASNGTYNFRMNTTSNKSLTTTTASILFDIFYLYMPSTPINILSNTGNFYVNHSWINGTGNLTNLYNISINNVWSNGTVVNYSNSTLPAHAWSNISIYAYNSSGTGTLNQTPLTNNTRIPNNAPVQGVIGNKNVNEGTLLTFTISSTDADGDILSFLTNATNGSLVNDTFSYTPDYNAAGIYQWEFNTTDNFSVTDSETIIVTVNDVSLNFIPPDPASVTYTNGTTWVNHTWQAGVGNVTNSYNKSFTNGTWINDSIVNFLNETVGQGAYSNLTLYAFNSSGTGTLSSVVTQSVRTPDAVIVPGTYNISGYINDTLGSWLNSATIQNGSNVTTSNSSGYYILNNINNGSYNYSFSKSGFNINYSVIVINGSDNVTNITLSDTTAPGQVIGLTNATPTNNSINISWSATVDANWYQIFRNDTHLNYTQNIYYNDTGLLDNNTYQYIVRANDTYNNWGVNSSVLNVTTGSNSTAPTPTPTPTSVPVSGGGGGGGGTIIISTPVPTTVINQSTFVPLPNKTYATIGSVEKTSIPNIVIFGGIILIVGILLEINKQRNRNKRYKVVDGMIRKEVSQNRKYKVVDKVIKQEIQKVRK